MGATRMTQTQGQIQTHRYRRLLRVPVTLVAILAWTGVCSPCSVRAQGSGVSAPAAAPATFIGTVLSDSTERPIANAEVSIGALQLIVRSDSAGNFTLSGITPGRYTVTIRAVGFAPFNSAMTFTAGERTEADLLLRPSTQTLERVDVTAKKGSGNHPRIAEFDERRKTGFGSYITQDEFDKADGRKLADVLSGKIPGLSSAMYSNRRALIANRGVISINQRRSGDETDKALGAKARCYVQVIVDGILRYGGRMGEALLDIDSIDPTHIAAAEYYTVSQLPPQFNMSSGAACGTLVIWLRY